MKLLRNLILAVSCLLIWLPAGALELSEAHKLALREFVASQNMREVWPEVVRTVSARRAGHLLEDARVTTENSTVASEIDRRRLQEIVAALTPAAIDDLSAAMLKIDAQALMEDMAFSVYPKYFSMAEIRQVTKFYMAKTGKKLLKLTPTLIAESKQTGAAPSLQRYFTSNEMDDLMAFMQTDGARKMKATGAAVKQDAEAFFLARSESLIEPVNAKYQALVREKFTEAQGRQ